MTRIVMNIPEMTNAARLMRAVSVEYEVLGRQLQSGALLGSIPSNVRYWVDSACRGVGSRLRSLSTELMSEARQMDWRTGIMTHNPVIGMHRLLSLPGVNTPVATGATSWFGAMGLAHPTVLVLGPGRASSGSSFVLDPAAVAAGGRSSRVLVLGPGQVSSGSSFVLDPAAVAAGGRSSRVLVLGPGQASSGSSFVLDPAALAAAGRASVVSLNRQPVDLASGSVVLGSGSGSGLVLDVAGGLAARQRSHDIFNQGIAQGLSDWAEDRRNQPGVSAEAQRELDQLNAMSDREKEIMLHSLRQNSMAMKVMMAPIEADQEHAARLQAAGYEKIGLDWVYRPWY